MQDNIEPIPMTIDSAFFHQRRFLMQSHELMNIVCQMQIDTIAVQRKSFMLPSRKDKLLNEIISDGYDDIHELFSN